MSLRRTWPVTVRREAAIAFVGIADRLGDGESFVVAPEWPALEQVAGDAWSNRLLSRVLPRDHVWGWWTRTEVFQRAKLGAAKAPDVVELAMLHAPVYRKGLLSRMALAMVPPRLAEQEKILEWAASDTEHVADILVTAPPRGRCFVTDLYRWCSDGVLVRDPGQMLGKGFERIVVIKDGFIYVALASGAVSSLVGDLEDLARQWSIELVTGGALNPWPFLATR